MIEKWNATQVSKIENLCNDGNAAAADCGGANIVWIAARADCVHVTQLFPAELTATQVNARNEASSWRNAQLGELTYFETRRVNVLRNSVSYRTSKLGELTQLASNCSPIQDKTRSKKRLESFYIWTFLTIMFISTMQFKPNIGLNKYWSKPKFNQTIHSGN